MSKFSDNAGREWNVEVNAWTIEQTRKFAEFDLCDEDTKSMFKTMGSDLVLLTKIIYACADPIDGIKYEQFARAMTGEPLQAAQEAFMSAYVNFFQSGPREALEMVLDKLRTKRARMQQAMADAISTPELSKKLDELLEQEQDETPFDRSEGLSISPQVSPA